MVLFSLVRLIAKKNTVLFLNIFYTNARKHYSLKALFLLLHTWIFYGIDVTIRSFDFNKSPQVWLSERFFKKLNTELYEFKYHYDARLLQKYNPIPISHTLDKKVLWLDDDSLLYVKNIRDRSLSCLKALKSIIDKKFAKNEVLYKRHPSPEFHSKGLTSIYSDYEECPFFMNADFIISNPNIKLILGGLSAVLCTAAKNTNIVAISYIKLIPFEDEDSKRSNIEYWMQESDNKIIFLDSPEELNFLIEKTKNL
jgi:hypothetical protein